MVTRLTSAATPPGGRGRCVAVATDGSEKWARALVSSPTTAVNFHVANDELVNMMRMPCPHGSQWGTGSE